MRRVYSASQVSTYLKCGKQWEFRYIDGLILPPKAALTVGGSVDTAVTENLCHKVDTGEILSDADVLDIYSDDFEKRAIDTEWGKDDKGVQKDMGAQLVSTHNKNLAPKINPIAVQESFVIETDAGYDLRGFMDIIEDDKTIVDTKTSKNKYAENAVTRNLQAAMYDFAFEATRGEKAKGFRFDVLKKPTKTKPAEVQQVDGKVTDSDKEWLFENINQVNTAIDAGIAMPAPDGAWWCSKDWCGFYNLCKGKNK